MTLLYTDLEAAHSDAAFRFAILGPEDPSWDDVANEQTAVAFAIAASAMSV